MVAAFIDLDVGGVARSGQDSRRRVVIQIIRQIGCLGIANIGHAQFAFARFQDFFHFAGADHRVDFRNLLPNIVAVALDHASGDDQFLGFAEFLVLGHLQNRIHRFFLRRLDETARIHHQHVRFAGPRRQFVTRARKNTHHHLAIDEVLGASQADETYFGHDCGVLGLMRKHRFYHTWQAFHVRRLRGGAKFSAYLNSPLRRFSLTVAAEVRYALRRLASGVSTCDKSNTRKSRRLRASGCGR